MSRKVGLLRRFTKSSGKEQVEQSVDGGSRRVKTPANYI